MFCSEGREAKIGVVEVVVVFDASLLLIVEGRQSVCKCTSLRKVDFCQTLMCIENGRVFLLLPLLEGKGVRSISAAKICDVATPQLDTLI
jgi:hypothetical protein